MNSARPSVYDVAAAAGVSTASISRYFRSPEKLSAQTRAHIANVVTQLGYLPSGLARGLAEQRTGSIGLYSFSGHEADEWERITPSRGYNTVERVREDGKHPRLYPLFADEVLRGVELECTLRRLPLAVGWQATGERGVELDDIARRSDGLIVLPSTIDDTHLLLLSRRMPLVLVSQPAPEGVRASSVRVDDFGGMHAMTAHLADDHGARRFAFAGPRVGAEHTARFAGFTTALAERGLTAPQAALIDTGSRAGSREAMQRLLHADDDLRSNPPQAIVCSSDQTALGVMAALQEFEIAVPTQIAVTGFDGIDAGRFTTPALTTIRQPMDELGREAVALLAEALNGEPAPRSVELAVTLVIRDSCGCGA